MTTTDSWLPLAEYSLKHHVSISTLRRRIKGEDIHFRFDEGKYFLLDEAPKKMAQAEEHRPSLSREVKKNSAPAVLKTEALVGPETETLIKDRLQNSETGGSVITAANKLLVDLKKAYTHVLHEKEEQIMYLKEEVIDLKTLIKVLEFENSRLRENQ